MSLLPSCHRVLPVLTLHQIILRPIQFLLLFTCQSRSGIGHVFSGSWHCSHSLGTILSIRSGFSRRDFRSTLTTVTQNSPFSPSNISQKLDHAKNNMQNYARHTDGVYRTKIRNRECKDHTDTSVRLQKAVIIVD